MENLLTPEVQEIALTYMEGLDCARSLRVAILIRERMWDEVFNLECSPGHYLTADDYFKSCAATEFLRKLDVARPGVDLEAKAIEKWLWAERECFKTNRRINEICDFGTLSGVPVPDGIDAFLRLFRKNLLSLVGWGPGCLFGRFGPGATVSDRYGRLTIAHKMSSVPTLTSLAVPFTLHWIRSAWGQASAARGDELNLVRGNSFFTVPKSATSRRSCAKEPSLNSFYQLGLGRAMRGALKKQGIDLDLGQDIHRRVACLASRDSSFCTIDLSSASDTVCSALVRHFMPPQWLYSLEALRSPFTRVNGRWHRLEKFSSMGNGFTFELETAIFAACCMTVMGDDAFPGVNLFVYGDDIIVPARYGRAVLAALRFLGFTPNGEKTFTEGNFRESCGGDFFNGVPVRAHYLKELPCEPQHYISLANGVSRVISSLSQEADRSRVRRAWFRVLDCIPSRVRQCRGPSDLGDIVIHDSVERWRTRSRSSIRFVQVYRPARFRGPRFDSFDSRVQMASALYGVRLRRGVSRGVLRDFFTERNGVTGYKVGWVPFS